jgi:hypothetical protein
LKEMGGEWIVWMVWKSQVGRVRLSRVRVDGLEIAGGTGQAVPRSHGGNLVKQYTTEQGAIRIDTLITFGTPQRSDVSFDTSMVGTYLNVYSKYDWVQRLGGPWYSFFWAGRTDKCAINIGIDWAPGVGRVGHGDLHTVSVWDQMVSWLQRAGYGMNPQNATVGYCTAGYGGDPGRKWAPFPELPVQQEVIIE